MPECEIESECRVEHAQRIAYPPSEALALLAHTLWTAPKTARVLLAHTLWMADAVSRRVSVLQRSGVLELDVAEG